MPYTENEIFKKNPFASLDQTGVGLVKKNAPVSNGRGGSFFGILAPSARIDYPFHIMSVIESIVRDLHELPPPKLVEVARFIHGLRPSNHERRKAALLATAGCMAGASGEEFENAVREEADRIDADAE